MLEGVHYYLGANVTVRGLVMVRYNLFLVAVILNCLVWGGMDAAAQSASAGKKVPPPENLTVMTRDGVQLGLTYYASSDGQEAVPVVLLHDWKESRAVFNRLAQALQIPPGPDAPSHAVVTVDLRGHGESNQVQLPNGQTMELDAARLRSADFYAMPQQDMEAVRKFLVSKNNAGELNLNKLCLVGAGMGANVAVYWAAKDWSMPPLTDGKQGQDVKGLVLISPQWNFQGLPLVKPMKYPPIQKMISTLIAYGSQDSKSARDAKNVYKILKRHHPEPPADELREKKDLFFEGLDTSLQATTLLTTPQFGMLRKTQIFLLNRIVKKNYPWSKRRAN
jgi:pimeloyl-ACP methyl ester carboxylesterase